jgi:aspartate kinase
MKVLKFGGTSVGSPERIKQVVDIVFSSGPSLVVLSAFSGTTNDLVDISNLLKEQRNEEARKCVQTLRNHYVSFVSELFENLSNAPEVLNMVFEKFDALDSVTRKLITPAMERSILAQGEILSTEIFNAYCKAIKKPIELLNALDFLKIDQHGEPNQLFLKTELRKCVNRKKFYVTQGFICRNAFGEIDNLKRGGSDYSASLFGAALGVEEIQIWTDIDGMHNNDPRVVEHTRPIERLSFEEAAELAYFGAKILHPSSVRPAAEAQIPVRLKNTMKPGAAGTLISNQVDKGGIKAIAAKDGITAIKIKSAHMLLAYGFLKRLFEVFEWYRTSIDMITTSEVAVSLTIDDNTHLDAILEDLRKFGSVDIDVDQSIICIVGDNLQAQSGIAVKVFEALKAINVRMISFGGSKNNVSVLIDSNQKEAALKALNLHLFQL